MRGIAVDHRPEEWENPRKYMEDESHLRTTEITSQLSSSKQALERLYGQGHGIEKSGKTTRVMDSINPLERRDRRTLQERTGNHFLA